MTVRHATHRHATDPSTDPIAYGPGILAYVDSFGGLVPARVERVHYVPTLRATGVLRIPEVSITADRPGYARGDRVTMSESRVVPRVHVIGAGSQSGPTIVGRWIWLEHPTAAQAFAVCECPDQIPHYGANCPAWQPGAPGEWRHPIRPDGRSYTAVTRRNAEQWFETLTRRRTTDRAELIGSGDGR